VGVTRTVVLYGRPDCHLCDEARDAIRALQAESPGLELREVDIDGDETLLRRYLERIPVVEVDGSVVAELVVDPDALRASLDTLKP
jgi:glutaredoxin